MKRRRIFLAALVHALAGILLCSSLQAQEKVDLKLNLSPGKSYKLRTVNENKMKTAVRGEPVETSQIMTMDNSFTVQEKSADGWYTITSSFDRVKMSMQGPMGTIEYNSAEPGTNDTNPMVAAFSVLAGKSYGMTLSERGKVKEASGMKEIIDAMLEKIPSANPRMRERMRDQYQKMLGEGGMAGKMFCMLPSGPVAVGESWKRTDSISVMMTMKIEQTYTLEALRGNVAVIKTSNLISTGPDAPFTEMGEMKMKLNVTGSQEGTIEVDRASGWIVGGSMVQKISGEQQISGPNGDMQMPLEMETTSRFEPL